GGPDGRKYGENLAWNIVTPAFALGAFVGSPKIASLAWSDEGRDDNYERNDCKAGEQCGHFTQVVWKTSERFGCGFEVCYSGTRQSEIWVCNYDPPGNMTIIRNGVPDKLKPF